MTFNQVCPSVPELGFPVQVVHEFCNTLQCFIFSNICTDPFFAFCFPQFLTLYQHGGLKMTPFWAKNSIKQVLHIPQFFLVILMLEFCLLSFQPIRILLQFVPCVIGRLMDTCTACITFPVFLFVNFRQLFTLTTFVWKAKNWTKALQPKFQYAFLCEDIWLAIMIKSKMKGWIMLKIRVMMVLT